eukprot:scaffold410795_cov39-Prasinocladus_malaysianus.AAC.1
MAAAQSSLGVPAVGIIHTKPGLGLTRDADLQLSPARCEGCWLLDGTMEDAVTCGVEPVQGLMTSLGLKTALCVVGTAREPSLGEDLYSSVTVSSARRAAVIGGLASDSTP